MPRFQPPYRRLGFSPSDHDRVRRLYQLLQRPAFTMTRRRLRALGHVALEQLNIQIEDGFESESEARGWACVATLALLMTRGMPPDPSAVRPRHTSRGLSSDGSDAETDPQPPPRVTLEWPESVSERESSEASSAGPSSTIQSIVVGPPAAQPSATTQPLVGSSSQSQESDSSQPIDSDQETDEQLSLNSVAAFNKASLDFAISISDELEPPGETQGKVASLAKDIRKLKKQLQSLSPRGRRMRPSLSFYEDADIVLNRLHFVIEGLLERIDDLESYLCTLDKDARPKSANFTAPASSYDKRRAEEVRRKVARAGREIASFHREDVTGAYRGLRSCIRRLRSLRSLKV